MTNFEISDTLSALSKLMDIHGENSFKSKSLSIAAFTIEKYYKPISDLSENEIANIKGVGISTSQKIIELLKTGKIQAYENLLEATQLSIMQKIEFFQNSKGRFLYARILKAEEYIRTNLQNFFGINNVFITGSFARQLEIIDELEYIIVENIEEIKAVDLFDFSLIKSDLCSTIFKRR